MRTARKLGLGLALSLAMAQAHAVDVDRIEIHSRLGEPLLAEIPVTGATAADLAQLQAQLASPTTFARIGLPRPQGVVAGLRFELVRGPRPVIRVTSTEPVQDEFLTFLMQVDAPQGRLVREYSLALGPAPALETALPPAIQAPVSSPTSTIVRAADPADALPVPLVTAPETGAVVTAATAQASQAPPIPVIGRAPRAPEAEPIPLHGDRVPARGSPVGQAAHPRASNAVHPVRPGGAGVRPQPASPAATVRGAREVQVRRGDTLTAAVAEMQIEGATLPQAMLAVLRTNPQAFGAGNIHQLRHGAVLRAPASSELTRFDRASAEAVVRLQTAQWQSADGSGSAIPPALQPLVDAAAPAPLPAAPAASARLEIASTDPEAYGQGTPGAGGTGDDAVARQRAAADLVAARYTEFQQMQQRIAELEQTQQAQQRLLLLKDRQLAAQQPQAAGMWPWLLGSLVLGVVLAGALGSRGPARPGRIARALAARVRGAAATRASTAR
jgi:pilus assembly protein FimV